MAEKDTTAAGLALAKDPERGRLAVGSSRYLLIRPETLVPLAGSGDPGVQALLEEGGFRGGRLAGRAGLAQGLKDRAAVERVLAFGALIGWGRFRVEWDGPAVVLEHSPFAEACAPSERPVCHLVRGVLRGIWSEVMGSNVPWEEPACAACGAPACRFVPAKGTGGGGGSLR